MFKKIIIYLYEKFCREESKPSVESVEKPKEKTYVEQVNEYMEKNPVKTGYELTALDLHVLYQMVDHLSEIHNIDSHLNYKVGVVYRYKIILLEVMNQFKKESKNVQKIKNPKKS